MELVRLYGGIIELLLLFSSWTAKAARGDEARMRFGLAGSSVVMAIEVEEEHSLNRLSM